METDCETEPLGEAVPELDPDPETVAVEETERETDTDALTEPVPVVVREGVNVRDTVPDIV